MAAPETEALVKGILDLVKVSASVLKDGFQVTDLVTGYAAIEADPVAKADLEAALKNIKTLPAEIKTIDLAEGISLLVLIAQQLPGVIDAFKK
jgi:hypothetical protein